MYTFSASAKLTKQFGFDDSRFRELVRRNINRAQYQSELASYCKKLIGTWLQKIEKTNNPHTFSPTTSHIICACLCKAMTVI